MSPTYTARQGRLRQRMRQLGVDAFLSLQQPNLLYLCGFTGSSGALLVQADGGTLFTDGRYSTQAQQEVRGARVVVSGESVLKIAGQALISERQRSVVIESSHLTLSQFDLLQKHAGKELRWIQAEGLVEGLRETKEPAEIAAMRNAAHLGSEVFKRVLPYLLPGVSENEIAAEIDYRMRRMGAQGPAFETIVAFGERTAWPHARPTARRLRKNELVLLDLGVILQHYCCDLTRTVYVGRAPARIRRMYGAVLAAHQAACRAVRQGVTAEAVDQAARRELKKHRLDRFFTHSTGHGLGLEVHETPRLARGQMAKLPKGCVVTIEPGVYIEGVGGVRIEDDVLVTSRGGELLTTASREFLEL